MSLPTFRFLPPTPIETCPLTGHSPSPSPSPSSSHSTSKRSVSRNTTLTLSLSLNQTIHQADNDTSRPVLAAPVTKVSSDSLSTTATPSAFGHPLERCPRNVFSSELACLPVLHRAAPLQEVSEEKKRGGFKRLVKRFVRSLLHSGDGKTDSRRELMLDPYPNLRRGPIRASADNLEVPAFRERPLGERPVFREIDWNPPPRLGRRGAMRGRRVLGTGKGECAGEQCCGQRGRDRTRPQLLEGGAKVNGGGGGEMGLGALELEEGWGREIVEMMYHPDDTGTCEVWHRAADNHGPGEGQDRQWEEVEGGDHAVEECWSMEVSRHTSPKTIVDGDSVRHL